MTEGITGMPPDDPDYEGALELLMLNIDGNEFLQIYQEEVKSALKHMLSFHSPHPNHCPCTQCT
ncbi:MAG: hypothetical protein EOM21_20110 [Gammaproteobacteria bacterium]|nr:hypothetical protein [Gammaproteobacteria bacterium]